MEEFNQSDKPVISSWVGPAGGSLLRNTRFWLIAAAVVVGIVAIAVVAGLLLTRNKGGEQAVAISSNVAKVTIEKTGLLPQTIKIKKGQEISWMNNDAIPHHITADQTMLPSFDTTEPLQTGDSYTYIFDKSGTFHYYDAADPVTFVGTIIVE